jgi:hypothetical protein
MNEIIKGIAFFRRLLALTSITSLSLNDKGKDKRKDLIISKASLIIFLLSS